MDLKPFIPAFQFFALVGLSIFVVGLLDVARRVVRSGTRVGDDATIEHRHGNARYRGDRLSVHFDRDELQPLRRATKTKDKRKALRAVGAVLRAKHASNGR